MTLTLNFQDQIFSNYQEMNSKYISIEHQVSTVAISFDPGHNLDPFYRSLIEHEVSDLSLI